MAPIAAANPSLFRKITRPYLTADYTKPQKILAIQTHYEFVAQHLSQASLIAAASVSGLPLLTVTGRPGETGRVLLQSESKFSKEGEMTLSLFSQQHDQRVYSLSFLITADGAGSHVMTIGATQGLDRGAPKDIIKDTAKALHGLRPKALLVYLAQELARAWGLRAIRAVSNARHISNHSDYRLNRSRRPKLTFDEFWLECDGVRQPDGFFALPLTPVQRPLEDIKPNMRSKYRQRYAMMEAVAAEMQTVLQRHHEDVRLSAANGPTIEAVPQTEAATKKGSVPIVLPRPKWAAATRG